MPDRGHVVTQVSGQKNQPEMGQVDLPQQTPGQAQTEPDQTIEAADENPRKDGLRQQVETWKTHRKLPLGMFFYLTCSFTPGGANWAG